MHALLRRGDTREGMRDLVCACEEVYSSILPQKVHGQHRDNMLYPKEASIIAFTEINTGTLLVGIIE